MNKPSTQEILQALHTGLEYIIESMQEHYGPRFPKKRSHYRGWPEDNEAEIQQIEKVTAALEAHAAKPINLSSKP